MTPLGAALVARIRQTGPITLAQYMAECLTHPEHGYYATRDPLGAGGDFVTAPEVSQMFGECLGLALAEAWRTRGAPSPFALVELGPGRGTLMADILRAARLVPGFDAAARVHLVETSPTLQARQAETLAAQDPQWHQSVETLPDLPLFVVANEFFDALPIRQFRRDDTGWRERMVGIADGALSFGWGPGAPLAALEARLEDTRAGDLVELSDAGQAVAGALGARIAQRGGVALIVDYGDWRSLGDTFQAVKDHAPVDPLQEPGAADLTAHVDFEALAQAAAPAAHARLLAQADLLRRLGIGPRAEALAKGLAGDALENHVAAFHRLTAASEMGTLFKALALFEEGQPPPPGFDT